MNWQGTQWNNGVKVMNVSRGFIFTFPTGSGHVNAVESGLGQVALGQTIKVTYSIKTISGKPRFNALDKEGPANFSVMLADGAQNNRWYIAGVNYVILRDSLDKGILTYSIKLKPQFWQNVNGQQNAMAFKKALKDFRIVQIVFGGKFRAHGVRAAYGNARFQMQRFQIIKP